MKYVLQDYSHHSEMLNYKINNISYVNMTNLKIKSHCQEFLCEFFNEFYLLQTRRSATAASGKIRGRQSAKKKSVEEQLTLEEPSSVISNEATTVTNEETTVTSEKNEISKICKLLDFLISFYMTSPKNLLMTQKQVNLFKKKKKKQSLKIMKMKMKKN